MRVYNKVVGRKEGGEFIAVNIRRVATNERLEIEEMKRRYKRSGKMKKKKMPYNLDDKPFPDENLTYREIAEKIREEGKKIGQEKLANEIADQILNGYAEPLGFFYRIFVEKKPPPTDEEGREKLI